MSSLEGREAGQTDYDLILENLLLSLQGSPLIRCRRCRSLALLAWACLDGPDYYCLACSRRLRGEKRHVISVPCECQWEEQILNCETVDLSCNGVRLAHPSAVPPDNQYVLLTFQLESPLTLRGQLMHTSIGLQSAVFFGVQFADSLKRINVLRHWLKREPR